MDKYNLFAMSIPIGMCAVVVVLGWWHSKMPGTVAALLILLMLSFCTMPIAEHLRKKEATTESKDGETK